MIAVALVAAVVAIPTADNPTDTAATSPSTTVTTAFASERVVEETTAIQPPPTIVTSATSTTTTTAPPTMVSALTVINVVDGDTLEVPNGSRVRLIGIDTPERGACGYQGAADALRLLVEGRAVTLVPGARDDVDRYGRLLRYVEVDGVDANLEMILSGRAIARYDSRDGYGRHDREDAYVEADAATASTNQCAPPPPTTAAPPRSTASPTTAAMAATDPRFGTCKEAKAAGYGPYVQGRDVEYDWYRDQDKDGIVCE